MTLTQLLTWLTLKPAQSFGLTGAGRLAPGQLADLAIFDLHQPVTFTEQDYYSKGLNTPFTGWPLQGKNLLTMVAGEVVYQAKEAQLWNA